jgi:hypothetical protein
MHGACQGNSLHADVRHRSLSSSGAGLAGLLLVRLPIGACGTTGRKAAPAAPAHLCGIPCAGFATGTRQLVQLDADKRRSRTGPRKQIVACVPHADGFVRPADMSQGWLLAPASPRSCELSPGHALEPSARYAVVCPLSLQDQERPSRHPGPGIVADLRVPFHAAKTIAARSVSVRDSSTILVLRRNTRTK